MGILRLIRRIPVFAYWICIILLNKTKTPTGGMQVANIQQLADMHMAIYVNKLMLEQGKITDEMHLNASRILTERLHHLEKDSAACLHKSV